MFNKNIDESEDYDKNENNHAELNNDYSNDNEEEK